MFNRFTLSQPLLAYSCSDGFYNTVPNDESERSAACCLLVVPLAASAVEDDFVSARRGENRELMPGFIVHSPSAHTACVLV